LNIGQREARGIKIRKARGGGKRNKNKKGFEQRRV